MGKAENIIGVIFCFDSPQPFKIIAIVFGTVIFNAQIRDVHIGSDYKGLQLFSCLFDQGYISSGITFLSP